MLIVLNYSMTTVTGVTLQTKLTTVKNCIDLFRQGANKVKFCYVLDISLAEEKFWNLLFLFCLLILHSHNLQEILFLLTDLWSKVTRPYACLWPLLLWEFPETHPPGKYGFCLEEPNNVQNCPLATILLGTESILISFKTVSYRNARIPWWSLSSGFYFL